MRKTTRLLALLICAALPATAWPQTVMAPAGLRPAGPAMTPAGRAFLFSLNFHLDQAAQRFGTLSAGSLPSAGIIAGSAREAEVARYLGRAALATVPQAAGPSIPAQAARFAAAALADPAARPRALAFLREQGALGVEAADKIEALSPKPEALESIRRLAEDLKAASAGGPGNRLESFFSGGDGSLEQERNASGPVFTGPEAFASYAERRFHPGLLRSGAAVAYKKAPRPAVEAVPGDKELSDEVALSPLTNPERERLVVELFRQAGAQASEIQLQNPPVAGITILDKRADKPPAFSSIPAGGGREADGVIQALLLAAMPIRLGVLEPDFSRPVLNRHHKADAAGSGGRFNPPPGIVPGPCTDR